MKYFYSSESQHGDPISYGFSNDTVVRVFDSQSARDNYVNDSTNLSCIPILRRIVTLKAANYSLTRNAYIAPRPFSGEYWGIDDYNNETISGCVGQLVVADPDSGIDRFYA